MLFEESKKKRKKPHYKTTLVSRKQRVKSKGIKVRGTGAATKGLYARGPMA